MTLLLEGNSNANIAASLNISQGTVKTYLRGIFDKYGVYSRVALIAANGKNACGISLNTIDEEGQVASSCPGQVCAAVDDGNNGDY